MEAVAYVKLTIFLFFALISLVLVPSTRAADVKYCDKKGNYPVKVRNVEISPDPVVSGKPATFKIYASTEVVELSGVVINGIKADLVSHMVLRKIWVLGCRDYARFHNGQAINGGKVVIEVSYVGVHVHTENHDLSEEVSCPIAPGDFVLSHSQTLPGYTPPEPFKDSHGICLLPRLRYLFALLFNC
ncbi:hypothetical protein CJ030_MR2G020346 [Morella rubra]|uniref:MD-2-related lipid-recognition domain-containing protein n=1 Tax=Morella rubra TaxID=262757 RepID=A0A6A1WAB9_9ROSI|nr:hypothetical protein CJ030_MR0G020329 [Morella rubra]KAB1221256.1 hypothetical protein CJ030_MR2G020346 [Morella rubra]